MGGIEKKNHMLATVREWYALSQRYDADKSTKPALPSLLNRLELA